MPAYDFRCCECGATFEVRMSISAYSSGQRPECPECGARDVERLLAAVNVLCGGGSSRGDCGQGGGFT